MSIVKMKFVNVVGNEEYFDTFVEKYIIDSSIQPENAIGHLDNIKGLSTFAADNKYNEVFSRCTSVCSLMGIENKIKTDLPDEIESITSFAEIKSALKVIEENLENYSSQIENIKEQIDKYIHLKKQCELLVTIDIDLNRLFSFEFIKFRFGRMPRKSYSQLQLFKVDLDAIIVPVSQDKDYMWFFYFTPRHYGEKIDGIFSSLYFERIRLSGDLKGTPSEALTQLRETISYLQQELKDTGKNFKEYIATNKDKALILYYSSLRLNRISEVKKYAAHTLDSFYLMGWMPEDDLSELIPKLDEDDKVFYIHKEPDSLKAFQPPTELRNNSLFKPFEMFVRMYGLPSYNEVDPTAFVAITYFIMFGMMFGDVGQGFALFASGMLLMKLGVAIGGVIIGAGLSSMLFGFVYGSIFGFEDWIKPIWINPMENINTMLITGIAVGVVLITIAMILNIVNGVKSKNLGRIFLDRNGVAGLVFYWGLIITAVFIYLYGRPFLPISLTIVLLLLPVIVIFFKEPIENLINKRNFLPHNKGIFFVQTFFELFDVVLSFLSNTISFIRLSAFALNHVGLFMAVFLLSKMANGFGSVVTIIIGNILIIGLEGLIVGIQALRLEYYELFSRFFSGDGSSYKPLKNHNYS